MALQQLVHVHVKDKVGYYGNLEWQFNLQLHTHLGGFSSVR